MPRPLIATVDLTALADNLVLAKRLAAPAATYAVVKANAYGHGLKRVFSALGEADGLALLEYDAALSLRDWGYAKPILLLEGFFAVAELTGAAAHCLSLVIHHAEQLEMLQRTRLSRPLEVFVKINTGMNRLGFAPESLTAVIEKLRNLEHIEKVHLMTHFAHADDYQGMLEQRNRFVQASQGLSFPTSLANSAGIFRYREIGGDTVRPGIMLYGASPFATQSAASLGMKPVMSLQSELIAIQHLRAGDRVGYGGLYQAKGEQRIGIVACGYADGYPRHAEIGTPIAVAGRRTQVLGRVSMDMLAIDLTDCADARVGSAVELWGTQVSVDEVAQAAGTVGYELLCAVAPRVPFTVSERK